MVDALVFFLLFGDVKVLATTRAGRSARHDIRRRYVYCNRRLVINRGWPGVGMRLLHLQSREARRVDRDQVLEQRACRDSVVRYHVRENVTEPVSGTRLDGLVQLLPRRRA